MSSPHSMKTGSVPAAAPRRRRAEVGHLGERRWRPRRGGDASSLEERQGARAGAVDDDVRVEVPPVRGGDRGAAGPSAQRAHGDAGARARSRPVSQQRAQARVRGQDAGRGFEEHRARRARCPGNAPQRLGRSRATRRARPSAASAAAMASSAARVAEGQLARGVQQRPPAGGLEGAARGRGPRAPSRRRGGRGSRAGRCGRRPWSPTARGRPRRRPRARSTGQPRRASARAAHRPRSPAPTTMQRRWSGTATIIGTPRRRASPLSRVPTRGPAVRSTAVTSGIDVSLHPRARHVRPARGHRSAEPPDVPPSPPPTLDELVGRARARAAAPAGRRAPSASTSAPSPSSACPPWRCGGTCGRATRRPP